MNIIIWYKYSPIIQRKLQEYLLQIICGILRFNCHLLKHIFATGENFPLRINYLFDHICRFLS